MAIKEIDTFAIGMYKVKNTSKVRLMLDKFQSSVVSVQLTDRDGNVIHREFISKKQMNYSKSFDLSQLVDGTYTFVIEGGTDKETRDVVIETKESTFVANREFTIE
jgi:hypothetical protein